MSRCDAELVMGKQGETKRVLINGVAIPGLYKVQTGGGPRDRTMLTLTLMPTRIITSPAPAEEEVAASGD